MQIKQPVFASQLAQQLPGQALALVAAAGAPPLFEVSLKYQLFCNVPLLRMCPCTPW